MGWSSIKNSVKKAAKDTAGGIDKVGKEYNRYSGSKFGAYVTPWASFYTEDGWDALRKNWGGYVQTGASAYNPAAGAVVGAGLTAYDAATVNTPSGVSAFTTPGPAPEVPATPSEASGGVSPFVLIGGALGGLAVLGILFFLIKKGSK